MKTEIRISKNQPDMKKLNELISRPFHSESILNSTRKLKKNEIDISDGFQLDISLEKDKGLSTIVDDFKTFMNVCMETSLNDGGYKIYARLGKLKDVPKEACEAFEINIQEEKCLLIAKDIDGLRRAFVHLEDEMTIRCYPALP